MTADNALVPSRAGDRNRVAIPKPPPGPKPIEKAAMILAAIGPELAAGFLRELSEPNMERFGRAVKGLGKISQEMLDAVISEFLDTLATGPELKGGPDTARKLLNGLMDEAELARLLEESGDDDDRTTWERLNDSPVSAIATFVQAEHPQTAAVVISELKSEIAAQVLERLDRAFAQNIVLRLARVPTLDPAVSLSILSAIERDFLSALKRNLSKRRPADLIAGLMNNISTDARDGFLNYLESQEPTLAQAVQRTMFTFEDIATRLHGRDIASVIREIQEEDLLKALWLGQQQQSATVPFVLANVPRRLSERYVEELALLADVSKKEGEAAQIEITRVIQSLAKRGAIRFIDKDPNG